MQDFANCVLKIGFKYGYYNNRSMLVTVEYNNQVDEIVPKDGVAIYTQKIHLPTSIKINTSGKQPNDTTVDNNGNIVEDMFVEIVSIELDSFHMSDLFLHQKIKIYGQDETYNTNYIGVNGHAVIEFSEENIFAQVCKKWE